MAKNKLESNVERFGSLGFTISQKVHIKTIA